MCRHRACGGEHGLAAFQHDGGGLRGIGQVGHRFHLFDQGAQPGRCHIAPRPDPRRLGLAGAGGQGDDGAGQRGQIGAGLHRPLD